MQTLVLVGALRVLLTQDNIGAEVDLAHNTPGANGRRHHLAVIHHVSDRYRTADPGHHSGNASPGSTSPNGPAQSSTLYHFGSSASKQTIPGIPPPPPPAVQPPPPLSPKPLPLLHGLEPLGTPGFDGIGTR